MLLYYSQTPNLAQSNLNIVGDQGSYNQMIMVDPNDRNTVYIGGQETLARTTDGGKNWTLLSSENPSSGLPYLHVDFHCGALFSGPLGTWIVVGTDGGLSTSSDNGVSWQNLLNNGLATHYSNSIGGAPYNSKLLLTGLQDYGIRSRNNSFPTEWDDVLGNVL